MFFLLAFQRRTLVTFDIKANCNFQKTKMEKCLIHKTPKNEIYEVYNTIE